jgi:hypothetical protein
MMDHPDLQQAMSHQGVTDWSSSQNQGPQHHSQQYQDQQSQGQQFQDPQFQGRQYQAQQGRGYPDHGSKSDQESGQGADQPGRYGEKGGYGQGQGGYGHRDGYQQDTVGDQEQ